MPLTPGRGLGEVDLAGTLDNVELKAIGRYLPLQTPARLRAWLTGALEGGTVHDASVRLRGPLAQFPFRADTAGARARGEFRVAGRIRNGKLNYTPGHPAKDGRSPLWPHAEQIDGSIVFDRARLEIKADTASTLGVALTDVRAVVPDLQSADMQLEIDGSASAPLQQFVRYIAASPVLDWIGRFTEHTRATNQARLALKLRLPLARPLDTKVQGTLQLQNNDVVLFDELPALQRRSANQNSERGVSLNSVAPPRQAAGADQRHRATAS
jgi:uncharacterized protein YhdP